MSWHKDHPELIPAGISALMALGALLVKAAKWLVFRLVELPLNDLKAELSAERADVEKRDRKIEALEAELKATTKELWQSLKTSEALAKRLERERGSSSPPSRSS